MRARFYFSFRSPYSYFAARRVVAEKIPVDAYPVGKLPEELEFSDPMGRKWKRLYLLKDTARLAEKEGLKLVPPKPFDTDWHKPHAAYLWAEEMGLGSAFMMKLYDKRWCEGRDIGEAEVVGDAARELGQDPHAAIDAMSSERYERQMEEIIAMIRKDRVFGVPFFVFGKEPFWARIGLTF